MIETVTLKFGRGPGQSPEMIMTTPITVFVGPNNSGKSKVLTELHQYCNSGQQNIANVIVDILTFKPLDHDKANQAIDRIVLRPRATDAVRPGNVIVGKRGSRTEVGRDDLLEVIQDPNTRANQFCGWFLGLNTLMLDGQSRISLVQNQQGGDLMQPPHTSFQVLFRDDVKRAQVRRIIHDAFGLYFVIDPTNLGQLRIKLSPLEPKDSLEERGIHAEAVAFHSSALPIDESSDGVKAFTGMITEIVAGDPSVLLIDEPEAFLHPALSFKLGKEIALATSGSEKRLFVSTHSPNFVMGCIQSGAPVNIVRLTYRSGVATARILPNSEILRLMRNPLLRSTNVLSGLFYEFIVVTESDADRAFYQEINERLLRFKPELGIPNCLFLNAQNKQTIQTIIKPLRELGIPAVAIVDIDVLKDGGSVWTGFLESGFIPTLEQQPLALTRASLKQQLEQTGKDMKRDGGINILSLSDKEAANNLLNRLAEYGLFVVRAGELESWLKHLGATGHGPNWLVDIFQKMGEDPDAATYVKPTTNDVWEFLGAIKSWLASASRKGIPS